MSETTIEEETLELEVLVEKLLGSMPDVCRQKFLENLYRSYCVKCGGDLGYSHFHICNKKK